MIGLDAKAARAAWTVFLVALGIYVTYEVRSTLVVFALAFFFAYLISPVVDFTAGLFPKRVSRTVSLAVVYCLLVGTLIVTGFSLGSRIAEQAASLAAKMPELLQRDDPLAAIPFPSWMDPVRVRVIEAAREQLKTLDQSAIPLLQKFAGKVLSQAGNLLTMVLIPILSFLLLNDSIGLHAGILSMMVHSETREFAEEILKDLDRLLAQYIRALVGLSLSTLLIYTLFLSFTGGPYALLLAGIAAVLEFIPVVGPLIAAASVIIVSGASGYPHMTALIVFILIFRMFQDYVLSPYLMGHGADLHPLLVLFGVLAGDQLAGIPGMFFSVPVIAGLRVVFLRVQQARRARIAAA
jgi:predicted PurR-regulated permease PerM